MLAEIRSESLARTLQSNDAMAPAGRDYSLQPVVTTSLARGASDECDTAVALPLTAVSSQNVIGSFEARFFCAAPVFGVTLKPSAQCG